MVRALLTCLIIAGLSTSAAVAQNDERLRLIYADILENVSINGQTVQILSGGVKFQKGDLELFTDRAEYYRGDARVHFLGSVRMVRPGEELTCDSLVFYDAEDRINAWGRSDKVRFEQEEQTLTCWELLYWTEQDSGIALQDVIMTQEDRRLSTDEFYYRKTTGDRGASYRAVGSVVANEGPRQISGQRVEYDDNTGLLHIIGDAVVQNENRELRCSTIQLSYEGDELQSALADGRAEATALIQARLSANQREWQNFVDVLTGRRMEAGFVDDRLSVLQVQGMASSTYHVVEDSILQGVNQATGDTLTMDFDDESQLIRIRVMGGARGRFEPEPGNTDVDTVVVYQAEYIDYQILPEVTYLERIARVDYKDNGLASGYIMVTWQDNLMRAEVAFDEQPTLYQTGHDPMYGELMEFDLVEEKGRVIRGKTRLEDGYYQGEMVYRHPGNVYYVSRSIYTTCELDTPHFYFAAQQMKMLQGDKVIAKPVILYLMDVPILGLPFIIFPNESGGRRSGWIMPHYGNSSYHGRYLEGLGYFWAINDYADATSWLDFFDQRGLRLRSRVRYSMRYRFSGQLSTTVFRLVDDADIANLFTGQTVNEWSGSWSHNQTIDPTQRLIINARFTSNPRIFRDYGLDRQIRLEQQIVSSANYSKSWPGTPNRFSIALQEKYDLQAADRLDTPPANLGQRIEEKSRTLPRINFSHAQSNLIKLPAGQQPKWYHNIHWSLSSSLDNHQSVFWEAFVDTVDSSLVWPDREAKSSRTVVNRARARNTFNFQATQNLFRYITTSLKLTVNQDWTPTYREAFLDTLGTIDYREINELVARHTGSISLSANTKIYGMFPLQIGSFESLRHVLTPSISYNYTPDFSKPVFGVDLDYYPLGPDGVPYDKFAGTPIGGTPNYKSQSLGISIANLFQVKREVDGQEVKTNLLTWNISTRYDFTADSLQLSPIRSSFRSPFLERLNLDISMEHDFYEWDDNAQHRINQVRAIPRLSRMNANTSIRLSGKRFLPLPEVEQESEDIPADTLQSWFEEGSEDPTSLRGNAEIPSVSSDNLWEATLALRYSLIPSLDPERRETFWLNGNVNLSIGPGWNIGYNARFDMITQELISHDLQLYRELHCWEFSFSWTPSGTWRGFMLRINVRDIDLQDIKYESRGGRQSFLGIY